MTGRLKRIVLQALGWIFIILGIAGLVLPILQGILFLMIGLYLLSREYQWARRWMERLHARYPQVFIQAQNWLVRLGLSRPRQPGQEPLPPVKRILALAALVALLIAVVAAGRIGWHHLNRYWSELQKRYEVVAVRQEDNAYVVELERTWALRNRRYVVRCHICGPVKEGESYTFEPVPERHPPMMKRLAGPGEVPDFYTVLQGSPLR